ncbi:hypothetical protein SFC08_16860 [Lysinibacillus halotolerans]
MNKGNIFKTFFALLVSFAFFNVSVNAEENSNALTESEEQYLSDVLNLSQVEISNIPVEEAKFLVENEAEVVTNFNEFYDMEESTSKGGFTTFATIPNSDLSFSGAILKINSTITNYDAFYAYANFRWLKKPLFALTDKVTIGFPSSLGVYLPASSGKIKGFSSSYSLYNTSTGGSTAISSSTTPSDWDPSGGVAGAYNLRTTLNKNQTHAGRISQTFYVKTSASGKATVKFEYGHKKVKGSVGISVFPSAGLSISPTQSNIDIKSYAASFSY